MGTEGRRIIRRRRETDADAAAEGRTIVRPHKREGSGATATSSHAATTPTSSHAATTTSTGTASFDLAQAIASFAQELPSDAWTDTLWGSAVSKKEKAARSHFGIPAADTVRLILDTTIFGSCKVGLALCDTGIYLRDEGGSRATIKWARFGASKVGFADGALTIDAHQFLTSHDGGDLARLLKQIQEQLAL